MKKDLNEWEKEVVQDWKTTFNSILEWKGKEIKDKIDEIEGLSFIQNGELKICLYTLFGNAFLKTIHFKDLHESLRGFTIYELLSDKNIGGYKKEDAENLVKLYISSYWGFLCR